MNIGAVALRSPFALAPMAGMTDTAFRRLVKRRGGCGLVVTEMVSAEGLVRGIDRTLHYAEYTEEERPVAIQIFGGDPGKMAAAAEIVQAMSADVVDVNMGCPVPKIARHNAGCSLMREPEHAASVVRAMTRAVTIPVTVKMRTGWDERHVNAPVLAKMMEDAGAAAVAVHGRTAAQSYSGSSDWGLIDQVARTISIPVFGSGDCVTAEQMMARKCQTGVAGVLVGRGALRNPWIFKQAADLAAGGAVEEVPLTERGRFLLDYIELLLGERIGEADGFRHLPPGEHECADARPAPSRGSAAQRATERPALQPPEWAAGTPRARWVVNKVRALASWYTKGLDDGAALRTAINRAASTDELRDLIGQFFFAEPPRRNRPAFIDDCRLSIAD